MTFVTWKPELATGIDAIDDDHRSLFDLVEQFHEAYMRGVGPDALEDVFRELLLYANRHFAREEALLANIAYPSLAEHRKAHSALTKEVVERYARFRGDQPGDEDTDVVLELLAFLSNWLHFHIQEEDMAYRDFMKQRENG